jgi:nucleotide-binding universal stress UspA family protein
VLVKDGRPADVICKTAADEKADAIIIPTHGHSGLKHALLGSVAEKVVRHAPCSVLVVRE